MAKKELDIERDGIIVKKGGRPPRKETVAKRKAMITAKARKTKLMMELSDYSTHAYKQLGLAVKQGKPWALKMYFEYYHGKPTEMGKEENTSPKINVQWSVKPEDIKQQVTVNVPIKEDED